MEFVDLLPQLWQGLGWPLLRLIFFISFGLFIGNLIESLNWTHGVARLASPLVRMGNLSDITGASFSMAFFSAVSANTMLSEAYDQQKIGKQELIFANLFNSLPTYFLHLPTLFFIAVPLIKGVAFIYIGLTLLAAFLRTFTILVLGKFVLGKVENQCVSCRLDEQKVTNLSQALGKTWERFKKRIRRILFITVPIYILVFVFQRIGVFDLLERFMAENLSLLSWLYPQSLGIIAVQLMAEMSGALAAAGALLDSNSLAAREVVLALLAGNVLSSPMRAVRHQLPFYAGIFQPRLAVELITYNQLFRTGSIVFVGIFYYFLSA